MPIIDIGRWIIVALLTAVLAFAAVNDVRERKIPNWTVLAVIALAAPWMVTSTLDWALWAMAAGAIALVASFILYSLGMVGAGDSKLFAAVALFAGLSHLPLLAVATALVGGVIAAVVVASRPRRALVMLAMRGKGDFGRGIPYGVAIAIAAIIVVWGMQLHAPLPTLADAVAQGR